MATEWTEYRLSQLDLPSDVLRMARSLDPPSPHDFEVLESVLLDYQRRLQSIRSFIELESQCTSEMAQGLKRLEPIARYRVLACQNIRATWRSLPIELWDKIFAFYVEQPKHRSPMFAPDTLMRVCMVWREAVLSSPILWGFVDIYVHPVESALGHFPIVSLSKINAIVPRLNHHAARGFPWTLTILFHHHVSQPLSMNGLPLATFIENHAAFRSVNRLKILVQASRSGLMPKLGGMSFPSVSSIVIRCLGKTAGYLHGLPVLPSLEKAVFTAVSDDQLSATGIAWSNLTHLHIGSDLSPAQLQSLFRLCLSLKRASVKVITSRSVGISTSDLTPSSTNIVLPHLEQLAMQCQDFTAALLGQGWDAGPITVFDSFDFPDLDSYRVVLTNYAQNPFRGSSLSNFGSLTRLTFISSPVHHEDNSIPDCLATILDSCPLLVELVASVFNSSIEDILRPLTFDSIKPRGQRLKALVLLWDANSFQKLDVDHSLTEQKFHDLVYSRRLEKPGDTSTTRPAALDRFFVRFCDVGRMAGWGDLIKRITLIGETLDTFNDSALDLSFEITVKSLAEIKREWTSKPLDWDEDEGCY